MIKQKPHVLIFGATSTIARGLIERIRSDFIISSAVREIGEDAEAAYKIDLNSPQSFDQAFVDASEVSGPIDAVVNCIGTILLRPAHLLADKDWLETLNVNLNSCFYITRAAGKHMLTRGGSVVFLSSAAALIGIPNHEAIAAAKAGVNGLMLSAAATYAANNIRFNCVAPGLVDTKLSSHIINNPRALETSVKMHPLGRIGQVSDIVNMIRLLIDPENSWISGQVFAIDGGLSHLKSLRS